MKSASTLKAYHERAICILELMQKAKDRVAHYKTHLKLFRDPHRSNFTHSNYRNENQIIAKIIQANRVYMRVRNYYFNLIKQLQ